jgi:hypothetical protein
MGDGAFPIHAVIEELLKTRYFNMEGRILTLNFVVQRNLLKTRTLYTLILYDVVRNI